MVCVVIQLLVFTLLGVQGDNKTCPQVLEEAGYLPEFPSIVAHIIHTMTLQDLQRFFKKEAPADNFIPSINPKLTENPRILEHLPDLPLNNSFNIFNHPALNAFDSVLSHMDDDDWIFRNPNIVEKIFHALHMLSLYTKAGRKYKKIRKHDNWLTKTGADKQFFCGCLLDNNMAIIVEYLKGVDMLIHDWGNNSTERMMSVGGCCPPYCSSCGYNAQMAIFQRRNGDPMIHVGPYNPSLSLPYLDSEAAWVVHKEALLNHLEVDKNDWIRQVSLFVLCKLDG